MGSCKGACRDSSTVSSHNGGYMGAASPLATESMSLPFVMSTPPTNNTLSATTLRQASTGSVVGEKAMTATSKTNMILQSGGGSLIDEHYNKIKTILSIIDKYESTIQGNTKLNEYVTNIKSIYLM